MSPRKPALPFDGYVRVSRTAGRAGDSFISPAVQRDTIARLAAFHGLELGEVVEELDVSGGKPIDARELGRLVRKVEAGESGGLLVWKVSRFSRSLLDGVTVADRVREAGGRIIGDDLDSRAPMGRAILGFLLGWAEEERDARRTGWREAQERAAARGVHPTRTPFGYARDDERRLVLDETAAPAVREAFELRAAGASLQDCADRIEAATSRRLSRSAVSRLFSSPTYLGRISIGEGAIYAEGAHPAIVDERTWTLAQRKGHRPRHDGSLASQGVLAGLLRCAGCGHVLTVTGNGPAGARFASYTCRKARASGVCPAPASAAVAKVDALVLPELDRRATPADVEGARARAETTAQALDAVEAELDAFLAAALVGELGRDRYAREVARRREAVEGATAAHREALDAYQELHAQALLGDGIGFRRGEARRHVASATLRKADERGRWHPLAERLELVWR